MLDHPSEQQGGELGQQAQTQLATSAPATKAAGSDQHQPGVSVRLNYRLPDWADDTEITNPNIQGYGGQSR